MCGSSGLATAIRTMLGVVAVTTLMFSRLICSRSGTSSGEIRFRVSGVKTTGTLGTGGASARAAGGVFLLSAAPTGAAWLQPARASARTMTEPESSFIGEDSVPLLYHL